MICTKADIPTENLFMIGIIQAKTTRDGFHFANPRKPFVVTRAEALNIIGWMIMQADFKVADVERAVSQWLPQDDPFAMVASDARALFVGPKFPVFMLSLNEGLLLAASFVRRMGLKPSEIDAAVMAVYEAPRGQETLDDMVKRANKSALRGAS